MYESPVNLIIFKDIEERQIVEEQDQIILKAITKCGVDVNKDELIKAINYDRNQYSKGYKDGANDALDKIRAEIAEYGSIWVQYTIKGKTDKDIGDIVENAIKQVKDQVLYIIDKHTKEREE